MGSWADSRLQELYLENIIFPELPSFLLSIRDLVTLNLSRIPLEGYISPETMVTSLVSLTRLARLSISFFHYTSPSGRLDLDPATWTRTILPALTSIDLDCSIRYMENLVARIDCPQLNSLNLYPSDSYNYIKLQVSQIYELTNRSEYPLLTCFDWVDVDFSSDHIGLRASHKNPPHNAIFLSLSGENWKLSHLLQVFSQFSPMLSNVRHLTVYYSRVPYQTPTNLDWMQLLVAFSALRTVDLYGGHKLLECVDGETAARLLPDLDLLYIEGRLVSSVSKFCAARRVSGRPVTLVRTNTEFYERRQ